MLQTNNVLYIIMNSREKCRYDEKTKQMTTVQLLLTSVLEAESLIELSTYVTEAHYPPIEFSTFSGLTLP
jgi:hypothetical protein